MNSSRHAGGMRGDAASVKPVFQDWTDVVTEPVRSRSFHCASGGVQLRVGAVWLDAGDREPLERSAWPAAEYTVAMARAGAERTFGSARVNPENNARLRWRDLPAADYCFVFESANRDPQRCLYVEFAVATFAAESPSSDAEEDRAG